MIILTQSVSNSKAISNEGLVSLTSKIPSKFRVSFIFQEETATFKRISEKQEEMRGVYIENESNCSSGTIILIDKRNILVKEFYFNKFIREFTLSNYKPNFKH